MKILAQFKQELRSDFYKNILTVFSGVSFAQVIPFIVSPILTRIYSPADFALLGLFAATAMLFTNISTLHYDQAIMLPKRKEDAVNIMALSMICVIGMTVLATLVVVFLNGPLTRLMDNENISIWLYLIPVSVFLGGTFRTLNMWASRVKAFRRVAMRNITQTSVGGGSKLLLGFLKYSGGLIMGSLAGQAAATTILGYQTRRDNIDTSRISITRLKENAVRYKDFPFFTNWQGFTDTINSTGTHYIISNLFGATILGWFSFTFGILQRPLQVIGQSVSQVYFQKISEYEQKGKDIWPITHKIIIRLSFLGVIIFLPIIIAGPMLFQFVFGEEWVEAGRYGQLMVPWLYFNFIMSPISSIPMVVNQQKVFLIYGLCKNLSIPIIFYIMSIYTGDIYLSIFLVSIFVSLFMVFMYFWFKKVTSQINN